MKKIKNLNTNKIRRRNLIYYFDTLFMKVSILSFLSFVGYYNVSEKTPGLDLLLVIFSLTFIFMVGIRLESYYTNKGILKNLKKFNKGDSIIVDIPGEKNNSGRYLLSKDEGWILKDNCFKMNDTIITFEESYKYEVNSF
jgi:hypothetical protein